MTSQRTSPELVWHNKEHSLVAKGRDGYGWSFGAPGNADRSLQSAGWVGGGAEVPNGLLVIGDALDAMMALQAAPRDDLSVDGVRLVYIDPPFNTGQSFAQYEDALDHSTWLSMFRDRLLAVKPLLAPTASVWVHLDDAEAHHARCVLDEVFGAEAFVATVIWQKRTTRESRTAFSSNHDYIHVYAPSGPKKWKLARNLLPRDPNSFRNRDGDPRGPWADAPFTAPGYRPNQQYEIINPAGMPLHPPKGRSWYATEPVYRRLEADNRLWFPKGGEGLPRMKLFPHEVQGLVPFSIWSADDVGTNDDAKRQLMTMFPHLEAFATPKPERLLERIIHIATDPGDLVLDFFAGSGTTPAVAHKLGRKWVAVERSITTAADYTIPRLHRVIHGRDAGGISARPESLPGGRFEVLAVEGCGEHVAPNFLAERLSALHVTPFDPLPTVGAKRPGNRTKKVASAEVVTMPSLFDEPVVPGPVDGVDVA